MESFSFFTIYFILITVCFTFPPPEFVSLGFTVESLCSFFLKDETNSFIQYHIKRTAATLLVHSSIPLFYVLVVSYMFPEWSIWNTNLLWNIFATASLVPPSICAFVVLQWSKMNWSNHPVAKQLKNFVTQGVSIDQVIRDINYECRSVNKVVIKCNSITKVIATDNWLIKISPYDLHIAHQSDVSLIVTSSNQYQHIPGRLEGRQYLTIDVKSNRANVNSFQIRINSLDFKELQEKVLRPINLMANIVVHQSLTDRFLETFRSCVQENPKIIVNQNLDVCMGCMVAAPNVKLFTSCGDSTESPKCTMCYCKPLWCVDCMGKWFASRQDEDKPETWLSSKCTCPMCRSTFCILDICPVVISDLKTENADDTLQRYNE